MSSVPRADGSSTTEEMTKSVSHFNLGPIKGAHERSSNVQRRRNEEHSPIYRLPPEILEKIILAIDSIQKNAFLQGQIMQISQYWFETITQCPRIWSQFYLSDDRTLRKLLHWLRGPVEIRFKVDGGADLEAKIAELNTLDCRRLRSLDAYVPASSNASVVLRLLQKFSPWLENIRLFISSRSPEPQFDLTDHGSPIMHLDVYGISPSWMSPRLSQLRTLRIIDVEAHCPSLERIHTILSSSPGLEHFAFGFDACDVNKSPIPETRPRMTDAIELPHLRDLLLFKLPQFMFEALVSVIRCPSCDHLQLSGKRPHCPEPSEAVLDLLAVTTAAEPSLKVRALSWGDSDPPEMIVFERAFIVELIAPQLARSGSVLDRLTSKLHAKNWQPESLVLGMEGYPNDPESAFSPFVRFPLSFPTVKKIIVYGVTSSLFGIMLGLLQPSALDSTTAPLPNLEVFNLDLPVHRVGFSKEDTTWRDSVMRLLERRYPLDAQEVQVVPLRNLSLPTWLARPVRADWPATSLSADVLGPDDHDDSDEFSPLEEDEDEDEDEEDEDVDEAETMEENEEA
ncbi:hypothetical protein FRB90_011333 [Tulasnella sp. 427]|nr:hypothetical protein FRB90_011333 [Tulasnella sp. 427]